MARENELNHLRDERSLYLRQHAHNPVDWYPWGAEASSKARNEGKPLFISIGYSACHWCHVMARESFQDDYVAGLLNRDYVSVKVDREERPDLDGIYMAACQMISGGGGWPLTVIATPEGIPFFAGTYFSKGGSMSSPGLIDVLQQVATRWKLSRSEVMANAEDVAKALREFAAYREPGSLSPDALAIGFKQAQASFDDVHGGFEIAPKFPSPHKLVFLMRYHEISGDTAAKEMVVTTLRSMARSGLFDHVGYGFHRYSTDSRWHVPHFEKMLYDQALLSLAYAEAFRLQGDPAFKETAMRVFAYVGREMTSPYGSFYSAESAESEGEEGKYYIWRKEEVQDLLGSGAPLFIEAFGIEKEGNFRDEATRRRTGANILHLVQDLEALAGARGRRADEVTRELEHGLAALFEARESRPRPEKDDKVLTDWNGLMIASLARSSTILGERRLAEMARRAADFLLSEMMREGRLMHRYVDGKVGIDGFLDDYAYAAWGMLETYQATKSERYLTSAQELVDSMISHFWYDGGGFFFTADDAESLIARRMEAYDSAMPSGNSVAAQVMAVLANLTGHQELRKRSEDTIKAFAADLNANPFAHAQMLQALMDLRSMEAGP